MSNDTNFTGAAGPATEELIFDASEARRARRPACTAVRGAVAWARC